MEKEERAPKLFEKLGGAVSDGFPAIHSPAHRTDAGTPYLRAPGVVMISRPQTNISGLAGFLEGFDPELRFPDYLEDPTELPDSSQLSKTAGQTCFDERTEILTDEGWRKLGNLNRREHVLTLNPETGDAEFQKPLAYQTYDYEGDLLCCEGTALSFAVTPDHRQWARLRGKDEYAFYRTEEIEHKRFAVRTAPLGWNGEIPDCLRIPGFEFDQRVCNQYGSYGRTSTVSPERVIAGVEEIRALALLCAYYATEGSLKNGRGGGVIIYGDHYAEVSSLAEIIGLKTSVWRDPRNGVLRTAVGGGRVIKNFFERECGKGCADKRLPGWVLNLPTNLLTEVWGVLVRTDGYRDPRGREGLATTSSEFAGQAQEILCKLGFSSSMMQHRTPENRLQVFTLSKKRRTEALANKNARIVRRPYAGKVYCITTENGVVFVRRDGKPHFSGNCYSSFGPRRTKNENAQGYFERLISAGHGCYDEQTEVLTSAGWKFWPGVSGEDELATLNTRWEVEYHRPNRLIRYRHGGRMYSVEALGVDLLVTPDHRMYACPTTTREGSKRTAYSLLSCEELGHGSHCYLKTGGWYDVEGSYSPIYALLGFAVGDGYMEEGASTLRFRLRRERKVRWLERVCDELGWELRRNGDRFMVCVPAEWRELFGGMYTEEREKILPQKLLVTLPRSALQGLFDGLMEADGCRTRTGDCYDTTSLDLAGQLQQLCLHLGMAANISQAECYKERSHSFGEKPVYRVHVIRRNLRPEVNKFSGATGRTQWVEDWRGEVFCAEVPNNTIYVRRNGKPVWSGNSVIEHANFSFLLYGVSRSVTHELVRHRAGTGFSQISQRYVSGSVLRFVERPEYQEDGELHRLFEERADRAAADYERMSEKLLELQEGGSAHLSAEYRTDARKKVRQTARSLLPNETEAPMVFTGNVRALRHIIEMRADAHAESEIRSLAVRLFLCLAITDPILFADYELRELPDGSHTVTTEYRKA